MTNLLIGIGVLTLTIGMLLLIPAAFIAFKWAFESSMARYYHGLREQIRELGDELINILDSENKLEPEARWAITELMRVARTREVRSRYTLKGALEDTRNDTTNR